MEPIQDLVRVLLEADRWIVRSDTRYQVPGGYSDLDVIAVRLNEDTGEVTERMWGEVKAHLEHSLTPGYLRAFAREYSSVLDLDHTDLRLTAGEREKLQARQTAADEAASYLLGPTYERVLFFAGPRARDEGEGARKLLRPGIQVKWVDGMLRPMLDKLGHLEGDEPLVRLLTTLKKWGMLDKETPGTAPTARDRA
ncbi:MAG: hypothetical protein ABIO70_06270 [Pseudomonadota bacterium]